jgi:hypothetical protein
MESEFTLDINDVIEKLTTVYQFFIAQIESQVNINPSNITKSFKLEELVDGIRIDTTCFEISVTLFTLFMESRRLCELNIQNAREEKSYDKDSINFIDSIDRKIMSKFFNLPQFAEFDIYVQYRHALYQWFLTVVSYNFAPSVAGFNPFLKNLKVLLDLDQIDKLSSTVFKIIDNTRVQKYYFPSDMKRNSYMINIINRMKIKNKDEVLNTLKDMIGSYVDNAKPINIIQIESKPQSKLRLEELDKDEATDDFNPKVESKRKQQQIKFRTLNDFLKVWNTYTSKLIDQIELGEEIDESHYEKLNKLFDFKSLKSLSDDDVKYTLVEKFVFNYSILSIYNDADPNDFLKLITKTTLEQFVDKKYFWAVVIDIYFNLIVNETLPFFTDMWKVQKMYRIRENIESLDKLAKATPRIWLTRNYFTHMLALKKYDWCENTDDRKRNLCDEYDELRKVFNKYYGIPGEKSIEAIFQQSLRDLKKYSDKMSTYKKEFDSWIAQQREKLKSSVKISVKEPTPPKREQKSVIDVVDAKNVVDVVDAKNVVDVVDAKNVVDVVDAKNVVDVVDAIDVMPKKIAEISEPLSTEQKEPLSTSELPERSKLILKRLPVVLLLISGGLVAAAVNYSWFVSLLNSEESETLQEIVIDDKNMTSKTNLSSIFTNFTKPLQKPSQDKSREDKGSFKVKPQKTAPNAIPKFEEKRTRPQKMSLTSAIDQFIDTNINMKKDVEKYVSVSKEDKGSFKVKPQKTAPSALPKPEEKRTRPQKMVPIAAIDQFIDTNINTKKDVEKYVPELIYEMFSRIPGLGLKEAVVCLFALSTLMGLKHLLPLLISKVTFIFAKSEVIREPAQSTARKEHTTRKAHIRHARKKSKRHSKSTSRRKNKY